MAKRHDEWAHTHVVGNDRAAAAPYLPDARKLLGMVTEDAAFNKLQTHQMTRRYDDGAVVIAEIRGGIPRMTIAPVQTGGDSQEVRVGDFVVWARNLTLTDGIDVDKPQQILSTTKAKSWRTFASKNGLPGRADGTYGGRFLKGVRMAGNVDWVGKDDERISWYGPSSRVWLDAYVHPRAQFGKFVFMLGEPLLDVDDYIAESDPDPVFDDRWVLGAALKKIGGTMYLYTIQSICTDGVTDMTDLPPAQGRLSQPTTINEESSNLYRYALLLAPDAAGVPRYSVVSSSRLLLAELTSFSNEPWFFNNDCSLFTCYELPAYSSSGSWFAKTYHPATGLPPDNLPATKQDRFRFSIDVDGWPAFEGTDALSLTSGGSRVPIATDYRKAVPVEMTMRLDAGMVPHLGIGSLEVPLWRVVDVGEDVHGTKRWLLHANVRDELMVFLGEDLIFKRGSSEGPSNTLRGDGLFVEIYLRGAMVNRTILYPPPAYPGMGTSRHYSPTAQLYRDLSGINICPYYYVYGVMVQQSPAGAGKFGSNVDFTGCSTTYTSWPHYSASYFATYDSLETAGGPPTPIATLAKDGIASNRADFCGNYSITGAQASEDVMVLSCAVPSMDGHGSFEFVSDPAASMTLLTGIGGPGRRYHPIWRLGELPRQPNQ